MSVISRSSAIVLVPAMLGLCAAAVATISVGQSGSPSVRCEIQIKGRGKSVMLEGVVFAKTAVQGSYTFRISKSGGAGHSDIDQSGDFNAGPDRAATLGTVTLGGDGGTYVAKLKVTAEGRTIECSKRVGGTL